jgi:ribosome-associated protein
MTKKTATKKSTKKIKPKKKAVKKTSTKKTKQKDEARVLVNTIIEGITEKKGKNILCLNLKKVETRFCDYFIIAEGDSKIQVEAIANSVEEFATKKLHAKPFHSEGHENAEWILIDFVDVVVHIFQKDVRHHYNLEALWADAEELNLKIKY